MTKLEQLKAAYEAATEGEWEVNYAAHVNVWKYGRNTFGCRYIAQCGHGLGSSVVEGESNIHNARFIILAHNLMPTLIEAVNLLETLRYSMSQYDDGEWFLHEGSDELIAEVDDFLEKLK